VQLCIVVFYSLEEQIMSRQTTSITFGTLLASAVLASSLWMFSSRIHAQEVTVYKSPNCGCCDKWIAHLKENGFTVETHDVANLNQIKRDNGITPEIASCHTALVEDYVVEGHVPADAVRRLLAERPDIQGITVPGMPVGSPGMEPEGHAGHDHDHPRTGYQILTFDADGNTTVYANR
jgi:hypothetical protein